MFYSAKPTRRVRPSRRQIKSRDALAGVNSRGAYRPARRTSRDDADPPAAERLARITFLEDGLSRLLEEAEKIRSELETLRAAAHTPRKVSASSLTVRASHLEKKPQPPAARRRGRPPRPRPKDEQWQKALDRIAEGESKRSVARSLGVAWSTFGRWLGQADLPTRVAQKSETQFQADSDFRATGGLGGRFSKALESKEENPSSKAVQSCNGVAHKSGPKVARKSTWPKKRPPLSEPVGRLVRLWNETAERASSARLVPTARPSRGIVALLEQHARRDDVAWWRRVFEAVAADGWWSGKSPRKATATSFEQVVRKDAAWRERRFLSGASALDGRALWQELTTQMRLAPERRSMSPDLTRVVHTMTSGGGGLHAIGRMTQFDMRAAFGAALKQLRVVS